MSENEQLRAEVARLRHEVDTLTRAVAHLIQQRTGYQAMLDTEHGFLLGDTSGSYADWPGRPRPDLVPEYSYTPPPRQPQDVLPRGGRNPRIGCEHHQSGTWIHGAPHDCPTWARR